jgi:hypothetical protein
VRILVSRGGCESILSREAPGALAYVIWRVEITSRDMRCKLEMFRSWDGSHGRENPYEKNSKVFESRFL